MPTHTTEAHGPDPIDIHVGAMIRLRRKQLSISQDSLAKHLGLTFQQVQKYERGANRVSASMLYRIAGKLNASIASFFDGLDVDGEAPRAKAAPAAANPVMALVIERDGLEIAQRFVGARPEQQFAIITCARALTPHLVAA